MAYIKCRYVRIICRANICAAPSSEKYMCEWEEDGEYKSCRFAERKELYIEGEYKQIKFDEARLILGKKFISTRRAKTFYDQEYAEGIHYLEIDGRVYISDDDDEEVKEDGPIRSAGAVAGAERVHHSVQDKPAQGGENEA